MPVSESFLGYVLEQLSGPSPVRARRMFGGVGLYRGEAPFRPFKDRPEQSINYFQVPAEVIEDAEQLEHWVRKAVSVAVALARPRQSGMLL